MTVAEREAFLHLVRANVELIREQQPEVAKAIDLLLEIIKDLKNESRKSQKSETL